MPRLPTISDIAAEANVSPATVSRVLNETTPVAAEKRAAVLAAVERLNFRPNVHARRLAIGRTMAIGILTQSVASQFYGELAYGIERGLAGSDYHPIITSGNWQLDDEHTALAMFAERQVDGLIVLGGSGNDEELRMLNQRTPVIAVGRRIVGLEGRQLDVGNQKGAYRAVRHLIELGHRSIAHITGVTSHPDAQERRQGYEQALREAGLPLDERLIAEGSFIEQSGLLALEALISRGVSFSALFAANDQMAYGARLGLYRRGLRVPDDISLVGFDDLPTSAYTTPPLTTVNQRMREQGQAAARAMLELLQGGAVDLPLIPAELVVRESTARLRA
jgi:LacI family transcriptional regulator